MRLLKKSKSKDYTDSGVYIWWGEGVKVKNYLTTGGLTDVWKQSRNTDNNCCEKSAEAIVVLIQATNI